MGVTVEQNIVTACCRIFGWFILYLLTLAPCVVTLGLFSTRHPPPAESIEMINYRFTLTPLTGRYPVIVFSDRMDFMMM